MSISEGAGAQLVDAIHEAARALVFISVPWSIYERHSRRAFYTAVTRLESAHSELGIRFFRLDADEDPVSHDWLKSVGFPGLDGAGAGSLLWLNTGKVVSDELNANSLGVSGIVSRTISLWGSKPSG